MRLDKYLADMNAGTRKEVKIAIRKQRVTVNGEVVRDAAYQLNGDEKVTFDGEEIVYRKYQYYMLNKPEGVVSAAEDARHTTVVDLIDERRRKDLFPVGRLDIDTVGLMLITNDGDLAHRLLSPKFHIDKTYYAEIEGQVTERDKDAFAKGLRYDRDLVAQPADLKTLPSGRDRYEYLDEEGNPVVLEPDQYSLVEVTIHEGKFHQIKKMFEAVGRKVLYLRRISMGPLTLDEDLEEGEYRPLTEEEIALLKNK